MFCIKRNIYLLQQSPWMQTMISSGMQLTQQQSDLKLEAKLTVTALRRNSVHVCVFPTCFLLYGYCWNFVKVWFACMQRVYVGM